MILVDMTLAHEFGWALKDIREMSLYDKMTAIGYLNGMNRAMEK